MIDITAEFREEITFRDLFRIYVFGDYRCIADLQNTTMDAIVAKSKKDKSIPLTSYAFFFTRIPQGCHRCSLESWQPFKSVGFRELACRVYARDRCGPSRSSEQEIWKDENLLYSYRLSGPDSLGEKLNHTHYSTKVKRLDWSCHWR